MKKKLVEIIENRSETNYLMKYEAEFKEIIKWVDGRIR